MILIKRVFKKKSYDNSKSPLLLLPTRVLIYQVHVLLHAKLLSACSETKLIARTKQNTFKSPNSTIKICFVSTRKIQQS